MPVPPHPDPFSVSAAEAYMRLAIAQAERGMAAGELPIGAVVVADGAVIASAHTAERATGRLLVHAELRALQAADAMPSIPGGRRQAVLFSTCEPCLMCLGATMSSFIGGVVYGLETPGDGASALVRRSDKDRLAFAAYRPPRLIGGVLRSECLALMKRFARDAEPGPLRDWAASLVRA